MKKFGLRTLSVMKLINEYTTETIYLESNRAEKLKNAINQVKKNPR
jgi:hypothetical protein